MSQSEIAEKVKGLFEHQALKDLVDRKVAQGVAKYGQPLDQNDQPVEVRAAHAIQEGVDMLQYLAWMTPKTNGAMLAVADAVNWLYLRFPNAPLDHLEGHKAPDVLAGSFEEWRERGIRYVRRHFEIAAATAEEWGSLEQALRNMLNTALSRGYADGMKFAMDGAVHEVPVEMKGEEN